MKLIIRIINFCVSARSDWRTEYVRTHFHAILYYHAAALLSSFGRIEQAITTWSLTFHAARHLCSRFSRGLLQQSVDRAE